MIYQSFITFILSLFLYEIATAQYNFDKIKICHNERNELSIINVGEYEVKIQGGKLNSFASNDSAVKYQEPERSFIIKNISNNGDLKLQLTNEGIVLNTNDTTVAISTPQSIHIESPDAGQDFVLYALGDFSFALTFKDE